MSGAFNILVRVIKRRILGGEDFGRVIEDYPKLSAEEIEELCKMFAEDAQE